MISTALKHQTWPCMQPMLMGSLYVKYLTVNLDNTPISGPYCCSQIQHPNPTPLASHSFHRIVFLTIIWTVSLCWCLLIPVTTIMHWLKLPSSCSPSLGLTITPLLPSNLILLPIWAVTANWILSLMAFQRISENQGLKLLQIFHTLPQAYGQPPVAVCLLSFDSPTCSFLCGPGFPDSAMQSIPPHDIFSWLYKWTGSKNCVLTAFYQKVTLLSLSAPNGEISFFQYNQIYCVFNMVLKFPDLLTAKPAPVHLM